VDLVKAMGKTEKKREEVNIRVSWGNVVVVEKEA